MEENKENTTGSDNEKQTKKYLLDADGIPRDNKVYREKEYWDFRFQTEKEYDWISDIEKMEKNSKGFLELLIKKLQGKNNNNKILNLGNGTSKLPMQLVEKGIKPNQIVSCDYIENVIKNMQEKYTDKCGEWVVADIRNLTEVFEENSFDIVLEKCTLDALTVSPKDPWNPDENLRNTVKSVFKGAHKLLKNKGDIFISLSFEQPHFRAKYFDEEIQQLFQNLKHELKIEVGFNECYVYFFEKI